MFLKLTADQILVFDWITGSSQAITHGGGGGRGGGGSTVCAKAKFRHKLTPGMLLTFLHHIPCRVVSWSPDILRM